MNFYNAVGYVGSAFMIAFSWTMVLPFALTGLVLLTVQAVKARMWNLVILNLASIIGIIFQLFSK